MAIKKYVSDKITCLSTDEKPTNLVDGADLYELDTDKHFILTGGAWAEVGGGGAIVQIAHNQISTYLSGSTQIPVDDTIPQKTEGNEALTQAITPTNVDNNLLIHVSLQLNLSNNGLLTVALFQDDIADALTARVIYVGNNNYYHHVDLVYKMVAGTISETTFRIRIGPGSALTWYLNGSTALRLFGGVCYSSITVTEITA